MVLLWKVMRIRISDLKLLYTNALLTKAYQLCLSYTYVMDELGYAHTKNKINLNKKYKKNILENCRWFKMQQKWKKKI